MFVEVKRPGPGIVIGLALLIAACGEEDKPNPFDPVPDCVGPTIATRAGDRQLVISSLNIATGSEGEDLDGNGTVDNKLALLAAIVNSDLDRNFKRDHDVVLPVEIFGYQGADSTCAKLQIYKADFNKDRDGDMVTTTWAKGDCLDTDASVKPSASENLSNRLDDDCDGYADNDVKGAKPSDTQDLDGDGHTLAMGDCDDRADADHLTLAKSRHPGAAEICDNGIDEDCDGLADNGAACDPNGTQKPPLTLDTSITPIPFGAGRVEGSTYLGGPGKFEVNIPAIEGAMLRLALIGVRFRLPLTDGVNGTSVTGGILAGVIGAPVLTQTTGLDAEGIISAKQSLLDAIFVGQIGTLLGLDKDKNQHTLPDMDIDGDGFETFYMETSPADGIPKVDTCVDGDGEIIRNNFDGKGTPCWQATDASGKVRFVDGLSVALKINAVPARIAP
jgi:hypothetical protein